MTSMHFLGVALVMALITAAGLYSGRKVKSAGDFTHGGRKAGAGIVAGSIIGTLVGGASTIGTAQLAFSYGFSAWWFTLGGGIGCLILGLVFAKPLYNSGIKTLPQIFRNEYGRGASTAAAILTSLGCFLSVVSQVLSGIALVTSISPLSPFWATVIVIALMLVYVVFGGVWGAGIVGMIKTVLMCLGVGLCGVIALGLQGGFSAFYSALPHETYFSLVARGAAVDLGAGLSLVLGVMTTQAYVQAIISARSLKLSRAGAFASAIIMPIIGLGAIFVGMYMKLNHPDIVPGTALPAFVMQNLPPVLAGIILATLLVALVGTGAGVTLGLSTMLTNDIYKVYINKTADDKKTLFTSRAVILAALVIAAIFSAGNVGSLILSWSFLSMGLRGASAIGPLCLALFWPGRLPSNYAVLSMLVAPLLVIVGKFTLPANIDPLYAGVLGSLIIIGFGIVAGKRKKLQ